MNAKLESYHSKNCMVLRGGKFEGKLLFKEFLKDRRKIVRLGMTILLFLNVVVIINCLYMFVCLICDIF